MPIQTDLNRAPYYDDYNEKDNYHKILFKPSVAVQVRELNQLQTILQNQIERFGDNVYKRGTIIDGCNFIFFNNLPYVKINDVQTDGAPVNVSSFKGLFAKNNKNLIAKIIETSSGYESTAPNLNSLHIQYLNSGSAGNTFAYSRRDVLTIYDPALRLFEADVVNRSAGFSNGDNLVIMSAISISNSTGGKSFVNSSGSACTFSIGEIITHSVTGAQAEIRQVNTTANQQSTILKLRPLADNLRLGNAVSWEFTKDVNAHIISSTSAIRAKLDDVIGSGAYGTIVTDAQGGVTSVIIQGGGQEYYVEPYITVSYAKKNNTSNVNSLINALNITSKNFKCKVTINDDITAVGNGTGIAVSEGIIYQKGHFTRVSEQFIVVDKYNAQTNAVVGFDTKEEIITFRQDPNLLDNSSGTLNRNAPGADRLKLTPYLKILSREEAEANNNFLPVIEYNLGKPFKQRKGTQFNSIAKELAQRTFEQSGNYVLDQFLVTTENLEEMTEGETQYRVNVDPGTAYIDGYRIQTFAPYSVNAMKGIDTITKTSSVQLKYGNYILIKEVCGWINTAIGGFVSLRSRAMQYLSTSSAASGTSQFPVANSSNINLGVPVGKARIRCLELVSGTAGSPDAIYALHLFDIRMAPGRNFATNVKGVYWNGIDDLDGVGDVVLDPSGKAILTDVSSSGLLIPVGASALKNVNAVSYTFRSLIRDGTLNADGTFKASIAQFNNQHFPYNSFLNESEKQTLHLVPSANAQASSNGAGSISVSGNTLTGTLTRFNTDYFPGDYIKIHTATQGEIKRIVSIANATSMVIHGPCANAYTTANGVLYFPQFAPIPLVGRTSRTANVNSNTLLTVYVANTLSTSIPASMHFNVRQNEPTVPKKVTRKAYVRLNTSTNPGGTVGPWCLGVPDIFRLRDVYLPTSIEFTGNSSVVTSNAIFFRNRDLENGDLVTYSTATSNSVTFIGNTSGVLAGNATANGFLVLGSSSVSKFSANQAVIYNVSAGNTVIGGLSNGSLYYVIVSNSTAIQLKTSTTGAAINLTSVPTSDQNGHNIFVRNALTGLSNNQQYYVINASANAVSLSLTESGTPIGIYANSGTDTKHYLQSSKPDKKNSIVSSFWIDHNQRKDYYDLGYLYKNSSYILPPNHDLLVEFDCFSVSAHGLKTIASYPIRDDLSLSNNNSAVHTLEIPELLHDNGDYFDLRDCLDFRTYRDNTAIITKDYRTATLNPIDFDGYFSNATYYFERFNKKFPVPQSPVELVYEQYLPRIDAVVLSGNGQIKVVKGTPAENPREPRINDSQVLLNHLIVQPYPSIPRTLGSELETYTNKRIQNTIAVERRKEKYTVSIPKTPSGSKTTQQKPYTMKDIASLERRIADLEYYVALSFTEDRVNNLQIASTLDGENRFKFGFFVDNFTTGDFAEISDPNYYAQIFGFELGPRKRQFKLNYKFNLADAETAKCISGDKILLPSRPVTIISQNKATEPTTVNISVTETILTTTGTEVKTETTRIVTISAEEWDAIKNSATSNTVANTAAQTANTTTSGNTSVQYRTVTKSRIVDVADGVRTIDNLTINTLGYNNVIYNEFVASKLGGTITFSYNGYNWYYLGGYYGYYTGYYGGFFYGYLYPGLLLERYQNGVWNPVQITSSALSPRFYSVNYTTGIPSTYYYSGWTANYTYAASPDTRFRFRNLYAWWWGYNLYLSVQYPISKQTTEYYTQQEPYQITVGATTSSGDNINTVYTTDSATGLVTKQELITSVSIVSNTQSETRSLFNPKPSALMRTDELFNLPESMNSPYIDLLSYIQSDINS